MRTRPTPLDAPPARSPYFTVVVAGETRHLRTPSLHRIGSVLRAVPAEHRARLMAAAGMVSAGRSLVQMAVAAPEILEALAALVGIAWADPVLELETPPWTSGEVGPYGAAVCEELHEAGWQLRHVALAGLAVARQVQVETELDKEVTAMAAFFRPDPAPSNSNESTSSATTSEPTPGEVSEN